MLRCLYCCYIDNTCHSVGAVDQHANFIRDIKDRRPLVEILEHYIVKEEVNISYKAQQAALGGDISLAYDEIKTLMRLNAFVPDSVVRVQC